MRRFVLIFLAVLLALTFAAQAETFKLTTGQEITGEVLTSAANDQGVQIKVGEGDYSRIPWTSFSQEDLKRFAQNAKMQPFVEPFIEITREEKIAMTDPNLKAPDRLELPEPRSLLGALFSSGVGLFLLLALLHAATIYAGFEVAIFRAQPPLLVAGLSAIPFLGLLAPIVFLAMPTRLPKDGELVAAAGGPTDIIPMGKPGAGAGRAPAQDGPVNPMLDEHVAHPEGLKLAHEDKPESALPQPVVFQRGQFTFNRRFFETKFPNFFGVVRREADKDMVLVITSMRGSYTGHRISRIAPNDLHVEVSHGAANEEVMIPFQEIKEIRLQHKDAK